MSCRAAVAFVGLGSNLDDPVSQLQRAFGELDALPSSEVLERSPMYWSPPLGPPNQPDYVNAVAKLCTELLPEALLDALQAIEQAHRRVRGRRWGPRTLDLDLLLFGDHVINTSRLIVPHPHLRNRAFVVVPLHDIDPTLQIPGGDTPTSLLRRLGQGGLRPV